MEGTLSTFNQTQFDQNLCELLSISTSRLQINSVRSGSVIVSLQIKPAVTTGQELAKDVLIHLVYLLQHNDTQLASLGINVISYQVIQNEHNTTSSSSSTTGVTSNAKSAATTIAVVVVVLGTALIGGAVFLFFLRKKWLSKQRKKKRELNSSILGKPSTVVTHYMQNRIMRSRWKR